jgi:hypothetical protein
LILERKISVFRVDACHSVQALSTTKEKTASESSSLIQHEKLLTALSLPRESVSASSATVKLWLAWSLEVFYGCYILSERTQAPDGIPAPSTDSPDP